MKQIEPIQYTTEGSEATQLEASYINDNGVDSCYIEWRLYDINNLLVNNGLLFCGDSTDIDGSQIKNYTDCKKDMYNFLSNNLSKPLIFI